MATPSGNPSSDPTIRRRFEGHDKDIEQIKRELVKIPNPQTPAPSALSSTVAKGKNFYAGGGSLYFNGWTITDGAFGSPPAGALLRVDSTDDRSLRVDTAGWYQFRWKQTLQFPITGSEPRSAQAELNNLRLTDAADNFWTVILVENHLSDLDSMVTAIIDHTTPWTWCEADDQIRPDISWRGVGTPSENYGAWIFATRLG